MVSWAGLPWRMPNLGHHSSIKSVYHLNNQNIQKNPKKSKKIQKNPKRTSQSYSNEYSITTRSLSIHTYYKTNDNTNNKTNGNPNTMPVTTRSTPSTTTHLPPNYPTSLQSLTTHYTSTHHHSIYQVSPRRNGPMFQAFAQHDVWCLVCRLHHQHRSSNRNPGLTPTIHETIYRGVKRYSSCTQHPNCKIQRMGVRLWTVRVFRWLTWWVEEGERSVRPFRQAEHREEDEEDAYTPESEEDDEEDEEDKEDKEEEDKEAEEEEKESDTEDNPTNTRPRPLPFALCIPSSSTPNVSYEVNALTCTCTCPDFVYRNKADTHSTCKHLRAAMAGLYRFACERGGVAEDGYVWLPGE